MVRNHVTHNLLASFTKTSAKLIVAVAGVALIASCASKTTQPTPAAPPAAAGPTVSDKDSKFDPQGSDSGKIDGLSTVHFDYDKSNLSAEAKKTLAGNAAWIKAHGTVTVQIEGHTDDRGSIEYNLALGDRRAKSVRQYMVSLGVDGKHMKIISYGKEKPIAQGENEEAYGKNRRANFVPLAE